MNYRKLMSIIIALLFGAQVQAAGGNKMTLEVRQAIFDGDVSAHVGNKKLFRMKDNGGSVFHVAAADNTSDLTVLNDLKSAYFIAKKQLILNDSDYRGASSEVALEQKVKVGFQKFLTRTDKDGYSVLASAISAGSPEIITWVIDEMFGASGIRDIAVAKVGNKNILHLLASRNDDVVTALFFNKITGKKVLKPLLSQVTDYDLDSTPRYIASQYSNTLFLQLTHKFRDCDTIDSTEFYTMPNDK